MSVISAAGVPSAADGGAVEVSRSLSARAGAAARVLFVGDETEGDRARVQRIGARFLGAGLVGYLLVSIGTITATTSLTAPWWPPVSVLLCIGPGLALIVASFRPGTAWLMPLAVITALGYLLAVALWFVAWTGATTPGPEDAAVWLISFPGMPSMVLTIVAPRWGVVNLVVACAAVNTAQQLGRFGDVNADLPVEILWACAFTGVFLAVAHVAVRTGRTLDETRADTYRSVAEAAAGAAREAEKARLDGIIHDRIIASLLAVRPGIPDQRLADQAHSALDEVARMATGDLSPSSETVARDEAIRRIRSTAADVTDRVEVEIVTLEPDPDDPPGDGDYPADVIRAVTEAMAEALRNVVRHAGSDAACAVIAQLGEGVISMAVVDDGRGFDAAAMPAGRLGLAVSIRERMAQIDGDARIQSQVGRGTTVQLVWERP